MEEMSKLEKVLDNTLDVSETMINDRFDKFLDMDKDKVNIVYLASVGTNQVPKYPGCQIWSQMKKPGC